MMRETAKRQMWVFAVICVALFVCIPLAGIMSMDDWTGAGYVKLEDVRQLFSSLYFGTHAGNGALLFLAVILLGALSGICGFTYLHSRSKVDFYHSLPIRREKLYLNQLAVSAGMYTIATVVNMLILMCVGIVKGLFTLGFLVQAGAAVVVGLVFFLMGFAISSIAMLLTGRTPVGILGTIVLLLYSDGVNLLFDLYKQEYFYTYYDGSSQGDMLLYKYFSPVSWSETIARDMSLQGQILHVFLAAAAVAVLVGLAMYLYRKRSLEQAENSMAFPRAAEVIEVLLVIPLALACGMFFQNMITYRKSGWLMFGTAFGLILFYCVIQMIYHMDFRKIFSHKLLFLISALSAGAIVCVFQFDLTGYDSYMPKQEDVKEISYATVSYFGENFDRETMENMGLGNGDDVYHLAQAASASSIANSMIQKYEGDLFLITRYELNNGKVLWRQYIPDTRDVREPLMKLYDNEKYLDYEYPIRVQNPEQVEEIALYANDNEQNIYPAGDKERIAFIQTLQEEMKNLDGSVLSGELPVGRINYNYATPVEKNVIYNPEGIQVNGFTCYIYPSFEKTLAMLEKKGYPIIPIEAPDVQSITIWQEEGEEESVYTSQEDIQAIMPCLIHGNLVTPWQNIEKTLDAKMEYITADGVRQETYYRILADKLPDILRKE